MFLGYIEIPAADRRYLDLSDVEKRKLENKKARKRRRRHRKVVDYSKKLGIKEADLMIQLSADCTEINSKTTDDRKLYNEPQKNEKSLIEIKFNYGRDPNNWD
ncbi:hypothetical protein COM64_27790 [Bacillus toyonensis]|uniref:hypothetical protein n=1 Tax=Bacillus toyonensis TaxID=155322 RepID=UPI000BF68764|nr:hypothetical protein [Bacillus toyonensis]PGE11504.1 hypothetical protein COM64_27790 [Bacillus toyonensis]